MERLPKNVRRAIRELCQIAHQRELSRELSVLEPSFQQWRQGTIDAFQLSQQIHMFHQGPARDLIGRYEDNSLPEYAVARAIVDGIVAESEIPEVAKEELMKCVASIRSYQRDV